MKQLTILSGRCLVVELPDGSEFPRIGNGVLKAERTHNDYSVSLVRLSLPPSNWRIIGMLSEVTEEQARQIARHRKHNTIRDGKLAERLMFYNHTTNIYGQATALESLESAILAEGWYFENPVKIHTWASENADDYRKQWEEGKKRVLCRERCLLLGREI